MTVERRRLPYGSWPSPIGAGAVTAGTVSVGEVVPAGPAGAVAVWWAERRPDEGGRTAVMRRGPDADVSEITPPDADVGTRVHEYGGAAWWVFASPWGDETLVYADDADQRLRRLAPGDGEPVVLTPEPPVPAGWRYADMRPVADGRWLVGVRERHGPDGGEPLDELVAVPTDGSGIVVELWWGSDFVMSPRPSPDGDRLAWIAWRHPDMPWDATALWIADLVVDGGVPRLSGARCLVDGRDRDEALCEPGWSPDGRLLVCTDRDDWWNLHAVDAASGELTPVVTGEFEIATPPWVFGMQRWACTPWGVVAAAGRPAGDRILLDGEPVAAAAVDTEVASLYATADGDVVYAGGGFGHETEIVRLRLGDADGDPARVVREVLRPSRYLDVELGIGEGFLPPPEPVSFPTGDGEVAHGLHYAPAHPDVVGPRGEAPPLLVLVHGGPTARARRSLHLDVRYWTSRGVAVVDVDYRGSTGYGRRYRRALDGRWGVADVEDCVAAATHLAATGRADAGRLVIRGSSAGGFTVLAALCFHDAFAAGSSRYGIADLAALARDTHKFESRYLDRLVGPWPEAREVYEARSPIHHVEGFSAPMLVLQGSDDPIVPPNQAEMIVAALRERGVPVAYILFEGERHGFRRAANQVRALEAELAFFGRVLGFAPADELPPIEIEGM